MIPKSFSYPIPWGGQLILTARVTEHLWKHRQRCLMLERGGQLFGQFCRDGRAYIELASGPLKARYASRTRYIPDRERERREIVDMYQKGLHYLGDWHTHPVNSPNPSPQDIETIRSCFLESEGAREALVMIIVGRALFPNGLSVSLINQRHYPLHAR